jgi:PIN domain nuclease of toxin-antitoxin system
MSIKVMDACALIAYLEDEQGADIIDQLIRDQSNQCVAHGVSLSEVYSFYLRTFSAQDAADAIELLGTDAGIAAKTDMDEAFWKDVGTVRAQILSTVKTPATGGCHKISLGDCFPIALARKSPGEVVTSDHDHFEHVKNAGYCQVFFFRP